MPLHIDIAAGSVQGHTHRRTGQNNQDAFAWVYLDQSTTTGVVNVDRSGSLEPWGNAGVIAVVCDGCGSSSVSEVGAQLGSRWVINAIADQLQACAASMATSITSDQFWHRVQQAVLGHMRSLTTSLQRSISDEMDHETHWPIIQSYLLFTIMGAVITPESTVIFGLGDGVFAINDDVQSIGPFANNAPPYLAYGLMPQGCTPFSPEELQFTLHRQVPTAEVRSLLIGSDGVEDLRAIADHLLPNKNGSIGNLSQFWKNDRYFKNPDMIRRRLALINREQTKPDWEKRQLTKAGGLLPDDTTLVVMRRSAPPSIKDEQLIEI